MKALLLLALLAVASARKLDAEPFNLKVVNTDDASEVLSAFSQWQQQ